MPKISLKKIFKRMGDKLDARYRDRVLKEAKEIRKFWDM